jgi:hypothetical protein
MDAIPVRNHNRFVGEDGVVASLVVTEVLPMIAGLGSDRLSRHASQRPGERTELP